jgi:hypothetical protein
MKGDLNMLFNFSIPKTALTFLQKHTVVLIGVVLTLISITSFAYYYLNGLGVTYNDARSHMDMGRRVVEGLNPGLAQLGSVWLPLPHLLMTLTVWNDFMWHSGLSGALQSMAGYVGTGIMIYLLLKRLGVSMFGRLVGVAVFALNLNILYLQSTPMTELLLLGTMIAGMYELILWHKEETIYRLIKAAFWIMLSTLIRYDGWFLFAFATALIVFHTIRKHGYKQAEGIFVLFCTLGGFGIFLWLIWNQLIFKDPLYFAFGPYSASHQQEFFEQAGLLATKHNLFFSIQTYFQALVLNSNLFAVILATIGAALLWFDKRVDRVIRFSSIVLLSPFFFNVLALFLGHSALFVQGLNANNDLFNIRYGLMMVPAVAIFVGYFVHRVPTLRYVIVGLLAMITLFSFVNHDVITIDDASVGASGANAREVSQWLNDNAKDKEGYVLISLESHDAVIFSSGLKMKRFIHEGTGEYWTSAINQPDKWARWIVTRTNDRYNVIFKKLEGNESFKTNYRLIKSYPYADIYELKPELIGNLNTQALPDNK